VTGLLEDVVGRARSVLGRGTRHRERLDEVETTIVVSGVRGKSSATRYLYETLERRGYDVLAKITGNRPVCLRDGERHPIEREGSVKLYENETELRRHGTPDVLVLENQAIGDYTNWVFNRYFADPDVVLFTNVRQDHRDTLGRDRTAIAQALARAVPEGTQVVSGEQDDRIRGVLSRELGHRDCPLTHVTVPEDRETVPGAEVVEAVDAVVEAVDGEPIPRKDLEGYLEEMAVSWTRLPQGRAFNAASVNDVESTEAIRRSLARQDAPVIQPLLYLRRDRRARTGAFVDYLDSLAERGAIEQARVVGEHTEPFARAASFPVLEHDPDDHAGRVLDDALDDGWPVVLMGNTVAEFMRDLETEIVDRVEALERIERGTVRSSVEASADDRREASRTGARTEAIGTEAGTAAIDADGRTDSDRSDDVEPAGPTLGGNAN